MKNYLGVSMLVMSRADMTASKLAALLTRKRFAARDLFDLRFFLKNKWSMNEKTLMDKTDMSLATALSEAEKKVIKVKPPNYCLVPVSCWT